PTTAAAPGAGRASHATSHVVPSNATSGDEAMGVPVASTSPPSGSSGPPACVNRRVWISVSLVPPTGTSGQATRTLVSPKATARPRSLVDLIELRRIVAGPVVGGSQWAMIAWSTTTGDPELQSANAVAVTPTVSPAPLAMPAPSALACAGCGNVTGSSVARPLRTGPPGPNETRVTPCG